MRFKILHTQKPKQFSFHTRYYKEKKLDTEDVKLEKGSFEKFKSRYRLEGKEEIYQLDDKKRMNLLLMLFFGLSSIAIFFVEYYLYGGIALALAIFFAYQYFKTKKA